MPLIRHIRESEVYLFHILAIRVLFHSAVSDMLMLAV